MSYTIYKNELNLNFNFKTINFLEENIRENLFDFEFGKTSLYTTVEVLSIKEKIDRINQNLKLLLFERHCQENKKTSTDCEKRYLRYIYIYPLYISHK